MGQVTVWFNNDYKGAQAVVVKWKSGTSISSMTIGKNHTEVKTFPMNVAKNFSIHRKSDNAMARKW